MELNRGQHPHSWVRAGGEWDMKTQKFIDPGRECSAVEPTGVPDSCSRSITLTFPAQPRRG